MRVAQTSAMVLYRFPDGSGDVLDRAAVITDVIDLDKGLVALSVFLRMTDTLYGSEDDDPPTLLMVDGSAYSPDKEIGSWHWAGE